MSIEQEIKELSGQIENLTKLLNSLILTNTNNNSNISDANFKVKQGEVFVSPATVPAGIISKAQGELKTTPDGIEVVKGGITRCRTSRI
ncbi:hypothetical protein [Rosenbergiella epipactidis]|uniref:hypothetical protein n=1 Tax=Rosenbergiella epipactidis TaxID=1544694 RepID=UPI001F4EF9B6|nr:hypothetical protein [Rosenbergiella epipactidis]